jgi:penicillin-insensitive murein endopeptidase
MDPARTRASVVTLILALGACRSQVHAPAASPALTPEPAAEAATEPVRIDWEGYESASIRNPNDGSLRGGVPLPLSAPGLRFNPSRDPDARYGTVEVVRALVEAAARVDRELGGLPVTVNDLSLRSGGPIPRHRSHQSGRDVDVLFYQLDDRGAPIESVGAFFDPQGIGIDFKDLSTPADDVRLRLDIPRIWLFLQALIEGEHAELQNIYVAEHIRTLLLRHARSIGVARGTVARFEALTCQPSYPHDDHFHFRFFCTPEDIEAGCRDSKPIYPWHRDRLAAAGVTPAPLAPKRPQAQAPIVTHEQAREAAGPMDAEVIRWLERRKQWMDKPRTGRAYCR